jgi:predicted lipid-binding transport protein (Tim44 family)
MKILSLVLVAALAFASVNADAARRMGGGKSTGQQSSNVAQRDGAGAAPATAGSPAQSAAAARPGAPTPAAAAPKRPWGAMLGGLAAGLGLAWLASSLGLGAAFGEFIMIALLVLVVMVVIGAVMRARKARQEGVNMGMQRGGFALQGAGGAPANAAAPRSYNPENVGNDASARPWERNSMAFDLNKSSPDASGAAASASALRGSQAWSVPADFDTAGFLNSAKGNFINLQDAWDRSDIPALRVMMTDNMLSEIKTQLAERESHGGSNPNKTEVMVLEAQLLGIEELADSYMASVEFSGMIREDASAGPSSFREVWNMTKGKTGGGWLVAGVQALQ